MRMLLSFFPGILVLAFTAGIVAEPVQAPCGITFKEAVRALDPPREVWEGTNVAQASGLQDRLEHLAVKLVRSHYREHFFVSEAASRMADRYKQFGYHLGGTGYAFEEDQIIRDAKVAIDQAYEAIISDVEGEDEKELKAVKRDIDNAVHTADQHVLDCIKEDKEAIRWWWGKQRSGELLYKLSK
jgi:hypothetical protein